VVDWVLAVLLAHAPPHPAGAAALRPLARAIAGAVDDTRDELANARWLAARVCRRRTPCDAKAGAWSLRVALRRAGRD
jgi:hypothetical protein